VRDAAPERPLQPDAAPVAAPEVPAVAPERAAEPPRDAARPQRAREVAVVVRAARAGPQPGRERVQRLTRAA
jgi:hypothetical protein